MLGEPAAKSPRTTSLRFVRSFDRTAFEDVLLSSKCVNRELHAAAIFADVVAKVASSSRKANVMVKTVAVLGASRDRSKYGNQSVRAHRRAGYEVFPINPYADEVEGIPAYASLRDIPVDSLDRVTVYLPPDVGITLLAEIAACHPREVWLNPGSERDDLLAAAERLGLNVICACSIVDVEYSRSEP